MATCKDCIHCDVCYVINAKIAPVDTPCDECTKFKAKSKFVELPCKVGDTVYFLCRNLETYEWYICEKEIYSINVYDNSIFFYISPICFFVEMEIGVRLFLTKEEAEKALKEREQE